MAEIYGIKSTFNISTHIVFSSQYFEMVEKRIRHCGDFYIRDLSAIALVWNIL